MSRKHFLAAILASGAFVMPLSIYSFAQPQDAPAKQQQNSTQSANQDTDQPEDQGQKVFDRNCSRCHNAPQGFSPRISGTILRHMRVRASLSRDDEKALLKFLNP